MLPDFLAAALARAADWVCRLRRSRPGPREQGAWGERAAARFLRSRGWKIVARNVRPVPFNRKLELDIIARHPGDGVLAIVEVKTHLKRSEYAPRLWAVDRRKKALVLRAGREYVKRHPPPPGYHVRYDVIEVYGSCRNAAPPEIDHAPGVRMTTRRRPRNSWHW